MHPALISAPGRGEFATRERCHIEERLNDPAVPDVSLARCRVEPGITTECHRLSVAEWYVVVAGQGYMEVGGDPAFAVGPGDAVAIPAGVSQRIRNAGPEQLLFDCICRPRFTPDAYTALDDNRAFRVGE